MHSEFAFCNAAEFIIKKAEEKKHSVYMNSTIPSVQFSKVIPEQKVKKNLEFFISTGQGLMPAYFQHFLDIFNMLFLLVI